MNKLTTGAARRAYATGVSALLLMALVSCASGDGADKLLPQAKHDNPAPAAEMAFPLDLPVDALMPWEELSAAGFAVPNAEARELSAINDDSLFAEGADSFSVGGSTAPLGRALSLSSGGSGSGQLSHAVYRIPLEGDIPSIFSADINLGEQSSGKRSEYYLAVSDYSAGRWQFHGPFSDSHVRIALPEGNNYASSLGNIFVAVFAWDGSAIDVVGLGVTPIVSGDSTPPPAPASAPQLTPVNGGLLIEWLPVSAGDLAGYRIYHRDGSFFDQLATGVKTVPYIEGLERHLLSGLTRQTFVRISAVDTSGNESELSPIASATPLPGPAGTVLLSTDATNVLINDTVTLTASGAESYDFDLDGDGDFEITGNSSGIVQADTSALGLIRPAVRGHGSGGTSVALGGVSLIVAVNIPPVAILTANTLTGRIANGETDPFSINFDASQSYDQDGGSLEYAFDLNADGLLGAFNSNPLRTGNFSESGDYYVALAVRDSAGLEDRAALLVSIEQVTNFQPRYIRNSELFCGLPYFSLAEVDGHPAVAYIEFAPGDGLHYCRALDARGDVWGPVISLDNANAYETGHNVDLTVIAGNPAVAYHDTEDLEIRYMRASNSTGQSSSDWPNPPVVVEDSVQPDSNNIELAYISGNPAMVWGQGNNLMYVRADGASGTGNLQSDWNQSPTGAIIAASPINNDVNLVLVNGNPAVATTVDVNLLYVRSTSSTGSSGLDWPGNPLDIDGGLSVADCCDLQVVNGNPAIVFYVPQPTFDIYYIRASTASGVSQGDWPLSVNITSNDPFASSGFVQLAVIGGVPTISHLSNAFGLSANVIKHVTAGNASGSIWGEPVHACGSPSLQPGTYHSLAAINGLPAIVFSDQSILMYSTPGLQN